MSLIHLLRWPAIGLTFILLLSGCPSSSEDSVDGGNGQHNPVSELSGVSLASDSGDQLDRVEILGLPSGVDSSMVYAVMAPEDAELVVFTDLGRTWLLTPLVDPNGSAISLQVTDGEVRSPPVDLELRPLPPPRAGAVEELRAELEDLLRAITEAIGEEYPAVWEYWRDQGFNLMPVHLTPLVDVWLAIADPENDASWVNQDFDAETIELLERVLASSSIVEVIRERVAWVDAGQSLLDVPAGQGAALRASAGDVSIQNLSTAQDRWILPGVPEIQTADQLSTLLEQYNNARRLEQDLQLFDETVLTYLKAVAMIGSISTGPAGATVISASRRAAINAIANAASRLSGLSAYAQWFTPCCFVELDIDLDPPGGFIVHEDGAENQVRLVAAIGAVESVGVDLTREIFDRLLGQLQDKAINPAVSEIYSETIADVVNDYAITPIFDLYRGQFPRGAEMVFVWNGIDMMSTEPQRWLGAEVRTFDGTGTPILEQASTGPDRYEFRLRTPHAFERSDSQLRFTTNFDELEAPSISTTTPIELSYIDIRFQPGSVQVSEPEEEVQISLTVHNAADTGVTPLPLQINPPGRGEISDLLISGETYTVTYTAPTDGIQPGEIVEIRATSSSEGGIRHPSNDPPVRSSAVFISAEPVLVDIYPVAACVESGSIQVFEALDPFTGNEVGVTWSVGSGPGNITEGGVYQAAGSGEALVTATAAGGNSATATVTVGSCTCVWNGRLHGAVSFSDGDSGMSTLMTLTADVENSVYTGLRFFSDNLGESFDDDTAMMFRFVNTLPFGQTGPTSTTATVDGGQGRLAGRQFSLQPFLGFEDGPLPPLSVTITERQPLPSGSGMLLAGRISGDVATNVFQDGVENIATLGVNFRGSFYQAPIGGGTILNCEEDF